MRRFPDLQAVAQILRSFTIGRFQRSLAGLVGAFGSFRGFVLVLAACAGLLIACLLATPAWAAGGGASVLPGEIIEDNAVPAAAVESDTHMLDSSENSVNARQTADNSFLYDTSIYELSQADATYQGNTVQVVGEVVGDSIRSEEDPGRYWITLEAVEEEYESSISVLVDEDSLGLIDTYGGYNAQGTTLQVRGIFYLACPSHEGIIDIHAEVITLVARGSTTQDEFHLADFKFGAALVALGLFLALIYRYLRERER